jgi:NADPH2 dehydrogenase
MSHLFSPIQLGALQLDNRIIVSPMCQYSAHEGNANDWHTIHLGQMALSGAGMLCIEATAVEDIGRITPGCLGLYSDENEAALTKLIRCLRQYSTMPIALQIGHAGRKGSSYEPWNGGGLIKLGDAGSWQAVAPSALPQLPNEAAPRVLSNAEVKALVAKFVQTAERAHRAGIDALELHGAHGYLLHEFLSPISNQRTDEYGGSFENRTRLVIEIFTAVRAAWPAHKPLGIRLSASDWLEHENPSDDYSWTLKQTIQLCQQLETLGCAWVDVSSAGISPKQKIALKPGYQVHFAAAIKAAIKMPVMAVGLITEALQAEEIIQSLGKARQHW